MNPKLESVESLTEYLQETKQKLLDAVNFLESTSARTLAVKLYLDPSGYATLQKLSSEQRIILSRLKTRLESLRYWERFKARSQTLGMLEKSGEATPRKRGY
jgi:hypothetical protein